MAALFYFATFRTIQLLRPPISEVVGDPEAKGSAFHFRVNGVNFFVKGANLVNTGERID